MRHDGPSIGHSPTSPVRQWRLAAFAFAATCVSVFVVNLPRWGAAHVWSVRALWCSLVFTVVLMGILTCHEVGHVWVARRYGLRLSLPWFMPFPWLVGTMGAVLVPLETPRDRTSLAAMAAGGPLAGAAVILLVLLANGTLGEPNSVEPTNLGVPLVWRLVNSATAGGLGAPSTSDPVGFACWLGCLVTALNLLPFGQLDGGHLFSSFFPGRAKWATWGVTGLLLLMGFAWVGWVLWCAALHLLGSRASMDVRSSSTVPNIEATILAWLCVVTFVLFAMPVPIS